MTKSVLYQVVNIVAKGRNAGNQHFRKCVKTPYFEVNKTWVCIITD